MDLEQAENEFKNLIAQLSSDMLPRFLLKLRNTYCSEENIDDIQRSNDDKMMYIIRDDIKDLLPQDALSPQENIHFPETDCEESSTIHVDAFLYDEAAVDALVDEGKMCRNYCQDCGSRRTQPLTFISHSASLNQIKFMFKHALPDLSGKTVVDVGSRLGAIVYGGYHYSGASHIVGVEMNQFFCRLQNNVIEKYAMGDRARVICADINSQTALLKTADVVIMNNVFEFFAPKDVQTRLWKYLFETLRQPGTVLITAPSIEESLQSLDIMIQLDLWLDKMPMESLLADANDALFGNPHAEDSDLANLYLYQVR